MTDLQIIEILNDLWRYEHSDKYTEQEIRFAIEYAINKIRDYHHLLNHYMTLAKSYEDYKERAKHEIPLPDNY